jgi:hypothetical protein
VVRPQVLNGRLFTGPTSRKFAATAKKARAPSLTPDDTDARARPAPNIVCDIPWKNDGTAMSVGPPNSKNHRSIREVQVTDIVIPYCLSGYVSQVGYIGPLKTTQSYNGLRKT